MKIKDVILQGDCIEHMRRLPDNSVDAVFADPPYAETTEYLSAILNDAAFTRWCRKAVLIWEVPADRGLVPPPPTWTLEAIRIFGGAKFAFFRRTPENN